MFFVSAVRSAGGAASYFASDNYYTQGENADASVWGGRGAADLGLNGRVDKDAFENLLNSVLPDGTIVNEHENKRAGLDLTFSMPKSASVLAYIGGDERILQANRNAVRVAMGWVEKNAAEVRTYERDAKNGDPVRTGNLVYAMFEHDTSRALDPQAHIHVVVAAMSKTAAGTWKALWNGEIYKNNSTIGSIYNAELRSQLKDLGYETRTTGKHGQFEIVGVPNKVIQEHSQRRTEILEKSAELGITSPQGQDQVVRRTRDDKVVVEDHQALRQGWIDKTEALGYDARTTVDQAKSRGSSVERPFDVESLKTFVGNAQQALSQYLRPNDPLATNGLARLGLSPVALRSEMAVASAIRILGQNEAAFTKSDIAKKALDLGFAGVTIDRAETHIAALIGKGELIEGKSTRIDGVVTKVTTPEHIRLEREVLAQVELGRGSGGVVLKAGDAELALGSVDHARLVEPRTLNDEQMQAAVSALSSQDRVFVIQGVGGAGKTTMVDTMARVVEDQGKEIIGLAIAATAAKKLGNEANIATDTVSAFVNQYIRAANRGYGPDFDKAKAELSNKLIFLDEGSMAGTQQTLNLLKIAKAFDVGKFYALGDREQLLAIEHGNPFASMQSAKVDMALLPTSMRQQTEHMKVVAQEARNRNIAGSFKALGERMVEAGPSFLQVAAEKWLALPDEARKTTDIYTSGRNARAEINTLVQAGLKKEGTLKGDGITVMTLQPVNLSREEMRYAHHYEAGMTLDVVRAGVAGRLGKGRFEVVSTDKQGRVWVNGPNGKQSFYPDKLPPDLQNDVLRLSERQNIKVHEGDTLRMGSRDKEREIFKSDRAKVLDVAKDKVKIQLDNGKILEVKPTDPLMQSSGLSYALNMHQAQGETQTNAIGALNSNERNLSTSRLFYVMVTRVRQNIEIITNNVGQLQRALETNMGDKNIALEVTGRQHMPQAKTTSAQVRFHPSKVDTFHPSEQRAVPEEHRGPQIPAPEKVKERGL